MVALVDALLPADQDVGGWQAGVGDYLAQHWDDALADQQGSIQQGLRALAGESQHRWGNDFAALTLAQQTALLQELEAGNTGIIWPRPAPDFVLQMAMLVAEGFYGDPANGGNRAQCSWQMVGYRPGDGLRTELLPHAPAPAVTPTSWSALETGYDVIVVGAGAAGGIVACVLAEAGKSVLLVERGRWQPFAQVGRDHLRNHRLARYGHNTGPELDGNPRVFSNTDGVESIVRPHENGYHNNAMGVGGGTRVYGAQAWRFLPQDFNMASHYGVPVASSLADWPLDYADLAPFYTRAEREVGVAGQADSAFHASPRTEEYPMPPVPDNPERSILGQGAARLGWHTGPVPLLINTQPFQGRPACVRCGMCVGFACPSESKNGSHNTVIPRALATGNCTLVTQAQVGQVLCDVRGKVTGVRLHIMESQGPATCMVHAQAVVLAAGAIESARTLLLSPTAQEPAGLGNNHDQVGRNLQGHLYPSATGQFSQIVEDGFGPGVSIATCDFNHGNPGIVGGGMLANEFTKLPIIFWRTTLPPDLPRWGLANKEAMRDAYLRTIQLQGPIQEIPSPTSRVTLAHAVTDRFGLPVARLSGSVHPESIRTAEFMRNKAAEWLHAAGAHKVWSAPVQPRLSAGQHQAGTCRMGHDPATSVTDPWGRVHGHENLFVIDGALHVTNGGFNPVLTIMALAFRNAEHLAQHL
ncbi:MAG: gluconate 2-dehydrogenase subunit 3 family protein [Caldilineaceae bacterium]|nr:gluconate 2-dehydrogenase subunit 3 family protein [Caldilineaceae bacterium]